MIKTVIADKFRKKPAFTMDSIDTKFDAKTIELGGVATGSIKAQLAAIVRGTIKINGFNPSFILTA